MVMYVDVGSVSLEVVGMSLAEQFKRIGKKNTSPEEKYDDLCDGRFQSERSGRIYEERRGGRALHGPYINVWGSLLRWWPPSRTVQDRQVRYVCRLQLPVHSTVPTGCRVAFRRGQPGREKFDAAGSRERSDVRRRD